MANVKIETTKPKILMKEACDSFINRIINAPIIGANSRYVRM